MIENRHGLIADAMATTADGTAEREAGLLMLHAQWRPRPDDHRAHLQGPLANRTAVQAPKQNLRVKTFVGTSANELHIHIWTALIALLILKYLQLKARWMVALQPRRAAPDEPLCLP